MILKLCYKGGRDILPSNVTGHKSHGPNGLFDPCAQIERQMDMTPLKMVEEILLQMTELSTQFISDKVWGTLSRLARFYMMLALELHCLCKVANE